MSRRVLVAGILLLISDIGLLSLLCHLRFPPVTLPLIGLLFGAAIIIPLVYLSPRYCGICGKRTRRAVPFSQRLGEYLEIRGKPRCSVHLMD